MAQRQQGNSVPEYIQGNSVPEYIQALNDRFIAMPSGVIDVPAEHLLFGGGAALRLFSYTMDHSAWVLLIPEGINAEVPGAHWLLVHEFADRQHYEVLFRQTQTNQDAGVECVITVSPTTSQFC